LQGCRIDDDRHAQLELFGVQQLEERDVVEVAELVGAASLLVRPRHQPLGVRADGVAEQVGDRHVAVLGRIDEAQRIRPGAQSAGQALRLG
jgi:hypothetical protein